MQTRNILAPNPPAYSSGGIHRAARGFTPAGGFLLCAVLLAGCDSPGIVYRNQLTGESVEVRQPPKSIAPATFSRGATTQPGQTASFGSTSPWSSPLSASTGAQQPRDLAAEAQTQTLTWVGIALIVAAIASIVFRAYLPVIPLSASLAMGGAGLMFLLLPGLLAHSVAVWLILAGVGALYALGLFDNRHKLKSATGPAA